MGDRTVLALADGAPLLVAPHDHQFVYPRLAVGSAPFCRDDVRSIRASGITHVLDCTSTPGEDALVLGANLTYLHAPIDDDPEAVACRGHAWFSRGWCFAKQALDVPGSKLLVHCYAGMNRGPSMLYAILRAIGDDSATAEKLITSVRPFAQIRFKEQAERWLEMGGA